MDESLVVIARSRHARYSHDIAASAVRDLFALWGLDATRYGTPQWNPLGDFIRPGARVVLKPNWVLHYNQSGQGMDCLITHPGIIEAVALYAAIARPASIVIGDAPVQGCDFEAIRRDCHLNAMCERVAATGVPVRLADFRRTILHGNHLGAAREEDIRQASDYVLYDLASDSLVDALAADSDRLRVTMYNPDLLALTHSAGRHQYLIAREVIEADVVLNLPKLKCHKKAGITGALKNLVGINGNKEYLPHHRKGGSASGGDCYSGGSPWKAAAENLLDIANRREPGPMQATLARLADKLINMAARTGDNNNLEGSWHGNDTVWRMCLDLQRILRYGRSDGTLADTPQRTVVSITDAIIGGEGEGPLASTPIDSGFVTGGLSTAALEWTHARLMGFDPQKIPLIREAFGSFRYPIVSFPPSAITVKTSEGTVAADAVHPFGRPFRPPAGWLGHCELTPKHDSPIPQQPVVA